MTTGGGKNGFGQEDFGNGAYIGTGENGEPTMVGDPATFWDKAFNFATGTATFKRDQFQNAWKAQSDIWAKQNNYQMTAKDMSEAGLNPALMFGSGSAGSPISFSAKNNSDPKGLAGVISFVGNLLLGGINSAMKASEVGTRKEVAQSQIAANNARAGYYDYLKSDMAERSRGAKTNYDTTHADYLRWLMADKESKPKNSGKYSFDPEDFMEAAIKRSMKG